MLFAIVFVEILTRIEVRTADFAVELVSVRHNQSSCLSTRGHALHKSLLIEADGMRGADETATETHSPAVAKAL